MFDYKLFLLIMVVFIFFVFIQIYYYQRNLIENKKKIEKIENFKSNIKEYLLDDESLKRLLANYEELKTH